MRSTLIFELIGHPASLIEETQAQCAIRLIGIESKAVDALLREAPYYVNAAIPAELYGFRDPVASFGVVATIVTSANMPETIAYTLVEAVVEHFESFKRLDPALNRLTLDGIVSDRMPAPLHPGALKFFSRNRAFYLLTVRPNNREASDRSPKGERQLFFCEGS
ncbi:TAXI family TRAP transporter solute-binding subunit [Roseibium salinum]|nr:TAXI family TRAP transporter solute-binding subunit [Roseibium salinum]